MPVATVPRATPNNSPRAPAMTGTCVSQLCTVLRILTSPRKYSGTDPAKINNTVTTNKTVYHLGRRESSRAPEYTNTIAKTANKLTSIGTWKVLKIHIDTGPAGPLIPVSTIVSANEINKTMLYTPLFPSA